MRRKREDHGRTIEEDDQEEVFVVIDQDEEQLQHTTQAFHNWNDQHKEKINWAKPQKGGNGKESK